MSDTTTGLLPNVRVFRHYNGGRSEVSPAPAHIVRAYWTDKGHDPRTGTLFYHDNGGPGQYWPPETNGYYSAEYVA